MSFREPILNLPRVVTALILSMLAIDLGRRLLSPDTDFEFLLSFAFIPFRFADALGWDPLPALDAAAGDAPRNSLAAAKAALGRYLLEEEGGTAAWSFVTHAFLHGGALHLGINAVWLAAFGSALARRFGAVRFLGFFAATAVAGALAHFAARWSDPIPLIGASGAISGCMAASALFMFQPGAPLDRFGGVAQAYRGPALGLGQALGDRRVLGFLATWVVINVLVGLSGAPMGASGEIAWEAHLGGFLGGLLLFRFFDPPRRFPALQF